MRGGPWHDKQFDAATWRTPDQSDSAPARTTSGRHSEWRWIAAMVAVILTSFGAFILGAKLGWW